jgi:hypothetical protein
MRVWDVGAFCNLRIVSKYQNSLLIVASGELLI